MIRMDHFRYDFKIKLLASMNFKKVHFKIQLLANSHCWVHN